MTKAHRSSHPNAAVAILPAIILIGLIGGTSSAAPSASPARSARESETDSGKTPTVSRQEYNRLRAENAMLRARLSLGKQTEPYLILDLPDLEMRLELQGVSLVTVPVRKVDLNRLASGVSRDTTHIGFCEVPFELQRDQWFEEVPTLALKDSSAVMSRPDTTGTLVQQIRTASVLSILHFDRNLVVALDGNIPPPSRFQRWKQWFRKWRLSFSPDTPEGQLARERRRTVMLRLDMEPAAVRTLAPNLTVGTKLILRF